MAAILDGIRILDVTRYVAGPAATMLLADLGADVIRIEPPGGGEDRTPLPFKCGYHGGVGFSQTGRNKRGITLNLASAKGREAFDRLLLTADIVFANLPSASVKSLGLDYERLASVKSDLIFVHLTTFGTEGPYKNRTGFDAIAQVMSGLTYISGDEEQPMKMNAAWVDMSTGFIGAFGALAALIHRNNTGEGQKVEANLLQTAMTVGNYFLIDEFFNQNNRRGTGNRAQSGGPADLIKTKDGWIYLVALGKPMFKRFARLIDREDELMSDQRFETDESRAEHGEALSQIAAEWASQYTNEEILPILEEAKIPAGPLLTPAEALNDPHVQEQFIHNQKVQGLSEPIPFIKPPATFSKSPASIKKGAPMPGEDNDEIFREAGFSDEDISAMINDGII